MLLFFYFVPFADWLKFKKLVTIKNIKLENPFLSICTPHHEEMKHKARNERGRAVRDSRAVKTFLLKKAKKYFSS